MSLVRQLNALQHTLLRALMRWVQQAALRTCSGIQPEARLHGAQDKSYRGGVLSRQRTERARCELHRVQG